jgi:hypothetical protein
MDALPVATSYSVINISLIALVESDHAVVVRHTAGSTEDHLVVACGEIGGVRRSDGALVVGLRDATADVTGIAYLAPLPSDPEQTQLSLFVAWAPDDE